MDVMPPLTVSPILRQVAGLKIDELNRAKEAFKARYRLDVRRSAEADTVARVKSLIEDVKKGNPDILNNDDLDDLGVYVDLAEDDWSFSEAKMLKFEEQIRSKLGKYLNRLEVSSLHVELMRNAMDAKDPAASTTTKDGSIEVDDFEVVENGHDEALAEFESMALTEREVDEVAIEAYLTNLLLNDGDQQEFETVRSELKDFSGELETDGVDVDQDFLMWCIVDVLGDELIDDEKKQTLQAYLQSPIALRELASTINVKSIGDWNYNGDKGLPISTRQKSNGSYCVVLEEDIVDMLFLHCVGFRWALKLKSCLKEFAGMCTSFDSERLTVEQSRKRDYFLGPTPSKHEPPATPTNLCTMCHSHPPAPMLMPPPPPVPMMMNCGPPPPPPAPMPIVYPPPPPPGYRKKKAKTFFSWNHLYSRSNVATSRNSNYKSEFFMSRLPFENGCTPRFNSSDEVQATISKTLAVELKLRDALDGLVYSGSAKFESLAPGLPHKTALAMLKFLGIPEASLKFVERFLSAKVNLEPTGQGTPDRVVHRARGVPERHALEMFLTEAVMFFLELAVRQKTKSYLYRLNNDCHFVGTYDQHEAYEAEVSAFADTMGLDVSFKQTLSIGFLQLNPGSVSIDETQIKPYAWGIKKQLRACPTMLEWVRVWNETAGTYAAHLFGPPSNIFGKAHLELVRNAYKTIFDVVLDGESLTTHVKKLLVKHVGHVLADSSFSLEAFLYLPQPYGGLGINNPFVTLNLAREVRENPGELIAEYLATEDTYYKCAAKIYIALPSDARARKIEAFFESKDEKVAAALGPDRDLTVFMTKEELTEHRESCHYPGLPPPHGFMLATPNLEDLYNELLDKPVHDMPSGRKVRDELRRLAGTGDMRPWRKLSGEEQWVLQLYGDDCFEKYDGLEQWVGELVPQEILKAVRGADWDDSDENSSCSSRSDMTEI